MDLEEVATSAGDRAGVVWTLEAGEDLNANLVRFGPGRGVGEHVNDEVDVLVLGVSGSGIVFAIPWIQIIYFVIAAIVVGILAAVIPARRAAHLNVLQALQYE